MFLDKSGERIAPGNTLRQSARIREKYRQDAAQQYATGSSEAQQKESVVFVDHLSLTLEST